MSVSRQRARDLVNLYNLSLERQIVVRGSCLANQEEELLQQVEALLTDGNAQEMHCLGVDPLHVMEESLKASAAGAASLSAGCRRRVQARGGLRGLAKAFQVLEQAALNLHLGPWREEYRVIKMYSGTFTHFISSVLSDPQTEALFGLLGYRPNSSQPNQLHLQPIRLGPSSLDDFLRLACAFFAARCECCLLLAALGKHGGDAQWELSLVRERQRGHSLQVSLDNTYCSLEVVQPLVEAFGEEVDLYGDEPQNGQHQGEEEGEEEAPRSLAWTHQSGASPDPRTSRIKATSSASIPEEPETSRHSLSDRKMPCSCLNTPHLYLKSCVDCPALHHHTCPSLEVCTAQGHCLEFPASQEQGAKEEKVLRSTSSSLALREEPDPPALALHPISFHDCCDLSQPDPRLLCRSCSVFHSASCKKKKACQDRHDTQLLGLCSCGRPCSRKPLVLCRYCGKELCSQCWYRDPVSCSCGQTFDQSSPV